MIMNTSRLSRARSGGAPASRRGSAIVPALLVVMLTATLSMIYLQVSLAKNKEQRVSVDSKRAFYMAEAGLAEAFNGLCIGKSGDVGTEELPAEFANGLFFVVAKDEGQGRITLKSTGLCGAGRATLSIVVQRQPNEVASRGFFGDQGITIEPGSMVDSFDSRLGTYTQPTVAAILAGLITNGARIGCNGDVTVQGSALAPTYVLGDAKPGQSGTLFRTSGVRITGSTAPAESNVTMPPVVVPTYESAGDVVADAETSIKPGEQGFGAIHVPPETVLTILGPAVIVADKLVVEGKIEIDARRGPIKLYVREGVKLGSTAVVDMKHVDPLGFALSVPASDPVDLDGDGIDDPPVTLDASGDFFGTVYAPNAAVRLQPSMEIYGGVSAQSLTLAAGTKVHYDRALSDSSGDLTGPPKFLAWRIVELPQVPLVSLRFDAIKELKREGKIPLKAKNAHLRIGERAAAE
jgi:hypothetical protein